MLNHNCSYLNLFAQSFHSDRERERKTDLLVYHILLVHLPKDQIDQTPLSGLAPGCINSDQKFPNIWLVQGYPSSKQKKNKININNCSNNFGINICTKCNVQITFQHLSFF